MKGNKSMSIGQIVKETRELKGWSREQLAKKIGITPLYLGHIERNDLVRISERLIKEFKKNLGQSATPIAVMSDHHNELVRLWKSRIERKKKRVH